MLAAKGEIWRQFMRTCNDHPQVPERAVFRRCTSSRTRSRTRRLRPLQCQDAKKPWCTRAAEDSVSCCQLPVGSVGLAMPTETRTRNVLVAPIGGDLE